MKICIGFADLSKFALNEVVIVGNEIGSKF